MATQSSREILLHLGQGERIADLCSSLGWDRSRFDAWWQEECTRRVSTASGSRRFTGISAPVRIGRDRWGIPHIRAEREHDLFFGFGYATAQDRLFQLDFTRRKALGRLAEVLGSEGVESDTLYRTIDLPGIAEREWAHLPRETQDVLTAYTAGVNALLQDSDTLPIEFDLLGYRPEAWKPTDSLAILGEFRWYLTGRFPVIAVPEMVKRALEPRLSHEFLTGELDEESILNAGEYAGKRNGHQSHTLVDEGPGSNNWVIAGSRTTTGKPLVASDPHIPFAAVSIWQEVHLEAGSFRVVGVGLAGVPAVMIGRNADVAWGITNNICSQRDLYLEKPDPVHPDGFLYHDSWEPARVREEIINVRGRRQSAK